MNMFSNNKRNFDFLYLITDFFASGLSVVLTWYFLLNGNHYHIVPESLLADAVLASLWVVPMQVVLLALLKSYKLHSDIGLFGELITVCKANFLGLIFFCLLTFFLNYMIIGQSFIPIPFLLIFYAVNTLSEILIRTMRDSYKKKQM